jgi:hypothetical protein
MAPTSNVVPLPESQDEIGSQDPFDPKFQKAQVGRCSAPNEVGPTRQRKKKRRPPFIPAMSLSEFAAVIRSGVSPRAIGLWGIIRLQAAVERNEWVQVRAHLKQSLGFAHDMAYSRAVTALEDAGLIEVNRRPGRASLFRLVPRPVDEGEDDV